MLVLFFLSRLIDHIRKGSMQIQIIFWGRGAGNYTGGDLFPVTLQCEFKSEPPPFPIRAWGSTRGVKILGGRIHTSTILRLFNIGRPLRRYTPPPRNGTYQIISAVPKNQQEVHRDRVHFNVWYFVSCFWMLERRRPHHVNYIHFSIAWHFST